MSAGLSFSKQMPTMQLNTTQYASGQGEFAKFMASSDSPFQLKPEADAAYDLAFSSGSVFGIDSKEGGFGGFSLEA